MDSFRADPIVNMMKDRIAILAVALLVLATFSRVPTAEPSRDLWVAILQNEILVPIGGLVDGKWWFTSSPEVDVDTHWALHEALGKHPVEWPPAKRQLPITWQAHLWTGETKIAHLKGPLELDSDSGEIGVRTDLVLPAREKYDAFLLRGVAVAGNVSVRVFSPIDEGSFPRDVLRFLDAPAIKAGRTAIKSASRFGDAGNPWTAVSAQAMTAGSFLVEEMSAVAQRDGSTLYYIEQSKRPLPDCEVHVRATVVKSRSGQLRLTAIEAEPGCDNYVNLSPVAIVERGGASCWVTNQVFEDGVIFTLTAPGIAHTYRKSTCTMK